MLQKILLAITLLFLMPLSWAYKGPTPSGFPEIVINAPLEQIEDSLINRLSDTSYYHYSYILIDREKGLLRFRSQHNFWGTYEMLFNLTQTKKGAKVIMHSYLSGVESMRKRDYLLDMNFLNKIKTEVEAAQVTEAAPAIPE